MCLFQCSLAANLEHRCFTLESRNNWQEKKRNNLKDFVNVAGPLGVTHFLILSNPKSLPHLRFAKSPQGPTFTFQIEEYALAADIANSQRRPRCPPGIFKNSPLVYDANLENFVVV